MERLTKEQRRKDHRARMAERRARQLVRNYQRTSGLPWMRTTPPPITANLSRRHPDYGKSPREHARAKAERNTK